jgi:protein HIRA/HIR1
MSTLTLDGTATLLSAAKSTLVAITSTGVLYSWYGLILNYSAYIPTLFCRDVKKFRANFAPTSVRPLLSPNGPAGGTTIGIASLVARPNGSPIVSATSGVTYSYDTSLCSFVKLSEPWWAEGSDAWSSRPRNTSTQQAIVASIESAISERIAPPPGTAQRPPWWTSALTLGHLESKLHAARVLDSGVEYKQILLVYAKKIADEGFRNKAEELIKDLFGPIYWFVCFRCREIVIDVGPRRPGINMEDIWDPLLLGHWKRDLLKEVLLIFSEHHLS